MVMLYGEYHLSSEKLSFFVFHIVKFIVSLVMIRCFSWFRHSFVQTHPLVIWMGRNVTGRVTNKEKDLPKLYILSVSYVLKMGVTYVLYIANETTMSSCQLI